mmetsp:Transcript_69159/g.214672  ORF Transcript_69159/g.214672 Transcript_69159/m.214672 type:complete len:218 (+) Transcript_69159:59-712(+)
MNKHVRCLASRPARSAVHSPMCEPQPCCLGCHEVLRGQIGCIERLARARVRGLRPTACKSRSRGPSLCDWPDCTAPRWGARLRLGSLRLGQLYAARGRLWPTRRKPKACSALALAWWSRSPHAAGPCAGGAARAAVPVAPGLPPRERPAAWAALATRQAGMLCRRRSGRSPPRRGSTWRRGGGPASRPRHPGHSSRARGQRNVPLVGKRSSPGPRCS